MNGDVIITLDHTMKPISETLTLDAGQVTELLAGGLYVNIHSDAFPAGEIRGQIIDSMCPDGDDPMNGCAADPSQGGGSYGLVEGSLGDLLLLIIVATALLLPPTRRVMRAS